MEIIQNSTDKLPSAFVWKKLHSLAGLWIVGFLMVHLFTNSQAALMAAGSDSGFIKSVNSIHELPFLPLIEIGLLAVPILIHTICGIMYAWTSKTNSFATDGSKPALAYPRNRAFTWQRITSWLLVIGIIAHVIHMRFLEYPMNVQEGNRTSYAVRVANDEGLTAVAQRLDVSLYNQEEISDQHWRAALEKHPLKQGELLAVSHNFGTAELLMLRDTFKMPLMLTLYTLLVLAACFHAFNGLWTFMIKWGITLTQRSQTIFLYVTSVLMVIFSCLGLSAVWFTYWVNLK